MFFVYVLYTSKFNRFYKGMTRNIAMRLDQHNKLQNRSTKAFVPWVLLFHESYCTRKEAREREKYLKSGIGREYVKNKLI